VYAGGISIRDPIPNLITRLSDDDPRVRRDAAHVLGQRGSEAAPAVPKLVELARDLTHASIEGSPLCVYAIDALAELGPAATDAVPALAAIIESEDPRLNPCRYDAIVALGEIPPRAEDAATALAALEHPNAGVNSLHQQAADKAIAKIRSQSPSLKDQ
jgi:HEAT repeat protein